MAKFKYDDGITLNLPEGVLPAKKESFSHVLLFQDGKLINQYFIKQDPD
ncbi:hypothetical protein JM79_3252 [Gramella sp. Hel_I_59]|nr:hypothetical protein [Gramella sp. Hel_I_59]TQI69138.1 hypothetical protein JM79_0005 [Gramella sp. Hel_I_59]TQI72294.1 hypothetical protein JM79_3252 [Gramella sp. Hel_I_59]